MSAEYGNPTEGSMLFQEKYAMAEDVFLENSMEKYITPEKIFKFLYGLVEREY